MIPPIVDRAWLDTHPEAVLVDVRGYLDGRDALTEYRRAHLPGARFVALDDGLTGPLDDPTAGRHPLPSPEAFAATLGRLGLEPDATVVAYDDLSGMIAGRFVWMLRVLGRDAALLDVGPPPWLDAESGEPPSVAPVAVDAASWPADAFVTADEVAAHATAGGLVIDARGGDRYRGETEPIDPRAGHIPGAVNRPFADNLVDGRFRPTAELAERFADVDDRTIFACGSGVSACHDLLAAEAAGRGRARLYVGSWSGWSSDPDRPVATGEQPG